MVAFNVQGADSCYETYDEPTTQIGQSVIVQFDMLTEPTLIYNIPMINSEKLISNLSYWKFLHKSPEL